MTASGFKITPPVVVGTAAIALFAGGGTAVARAHITYPSALHAEPSVGAFDAHSIFASGKVWVSLAGLRGGGSVQVGGDAVSSTQAYYWTDTWQREESASMAEHNAGEYVRFNDVDEALAWLNEPEA